MITDQMLKQWTIFTSLTSTDLVTGFPLRIGLMSRMHYSILSIISFPHVTIDYMKMPCITFCSTCFHIKRKSINDMCFHLVKNRLWRSIDQSRQQISNTLHCLCSTCYAMKKMRCTRTMYLMWVNIERSVKIFEFISPIVLMTLQTSC